jgi:hypothetical protein
MPIKRNATVRILGRFGILISGPGGVIDNIGQLPKEVPGETFSAWKKEFLKITKVIYMSTCQQILNLK